MAEKAKPKTIAIEEHYQDRELASHFTGRDAWKPEPLVARMEDFTGVRLKEMDEAGIDMQVISHGAPATQKLKADVAAEVTRGVNDRLHAAIKDHGDRFAAFSALPTADPKAAVKELERTTALGFKGPMIHGLTNGEFIDEKKYWPIFECASALDLPVYIHPGIPDERVIDVYYKTYTESFPWILTAGWGFTVETATQAVRLVLSGVCDKYPDLKIILGHLGEGLPFSVGRMDEAFSRPGNAPLNYREVFTRNFYLTTSGNFSDPALLCCMQEFGTDRIMFAVDWPFVSNKPAVEWMAEVPLGADDKAKILSGNARRILKL